jgi:hypothetical protein
MTATSTESESAIEIPKGRHKAPVHSPNEFHINPETGGLEAGLLHTQYPANVKPVSPEEMKALEAREQAVAEAESRAQQLIEQAKGEIEQERAKLEAERAAFEKEKAAAADAEGKAFAAGKLPEADRRTTAQPAKKKK